MNVAITAENRGNTRRKAGLIKINAGVLLGQSQHHPEHEAGKKTSTALATEAMTVQLGAIARLPMSAQRGRCQSVSPQTFQLLSDRYQPRPTVHRLGARAREIIEEFRPGSSLTGRLQLLGQRDRPDVPRNLVPTVTPRPARRGCIAPNRLLNALGLMVARRIRGSAGGSLVSVAAAYSSDRLPALPSSSTVAGPPSEPKSHNADFFQSPQSLQQIGLPQKPPRGSPVPIAIRRSVLRGAAERSRPSTAGRQPRAISCPSIPSSLAASVLMTVRRARFWPPSSRVCRSPR